MKVTKDMLDLARHIVNHAGHFEPEKFENHYETALMELINQKRAGKPITPKDKRAATNVVNLREALGRSVARDPVEGGEGRQEAAQGGGWPEGEADANRGQEARKAGGCEEAVGGGAAEDGMTDLAP